MDLDDYQPSQLTKKGKAQCWDLADKFRVWINFMTRMVLSPKQDGSYFRVIFDDRTAQAAVVTAAILCAIQRKNND